MASHPECVLADKAGGRGGKEKWQKEVVHPLNMFF